MVMLKLLLNIPLESIKGSVGGDTPLVPLTLTADTWNWYQWPGLMSFTFTVVSIAWKHNHGNQDQINKAITAESDHFDIKENTNSNPSSGYNFTIYK